MWTAIILIVLFIFGAYLSEETDYIELGAIIAVVCVALFIANIVGWTSTSYRYNVLEIERNSFVSTLKHARENGSELEVATIVRDIVKWNKELMVYKYQNKIFILGNYIDDRVELLEPIK